MAMDPVVGPTLIGIAGPTAHKVATKSAEELGILEKAEDSTHTLLAEILEHLIEIQKAVTDTSRELTWTETLGDLFSPVKLDKKGLKYQAIFTPVAIPNLVMDVVGLGNYVVNLPAGWSFTPFPSDTHIWLQAPGTNANVLMWATDDTIGVAI